MDQGKKNTASTRESITIVVSLAIMFGFKFLPPLKGLTPVGMDILGIFIATMILWLAISVEWPSILCMAALALTPVLDYNKVLSGSMGNWVITFLIFSFVLTHTLNEAGFLRRCAIWFITRPIAKNNTWVFLGLYFLAVLVMGLFMSPIPTFLVFLPIAEQIFRMLNYTKGERLPHMMVLGTSIAAGIAQGSTPIAHTFPLMAISFFKRDAGYDINFFSYMGFGLVSGLATFLVMMLAFRYLYRPDISKFKDLDIDEIKRSVSPMSKREKVAVAVFGLVVLAWLLPGIIEPILPAIGKQLNSYGAALPAMFGTIALLILKVDGKPVLNLQSAISKGVPWASLFLAASALILGSAMSMKEVGLADYIGKLLLPIAKALPPQLFVMMIVAWTTIMTNFASNGVVVTLVYGIAIPLAKQMGGQINPAALAALIGGASCYAFATPPATAHAAIAAGTGWVDLKDMFKYGMLVAIACVIVYTFVGYPLAAMFMR